MTIERDPWHFVTVAEMRALAKTHGLSGYTAMRRDALVDLLDDANVGVPTATLSAATSRDGELRTIGPFAGLSRPARARSQVEVHDGMYAGTDTHGKRVEVSLVNPDTRRWQIRSQGVLDQPKVRECDDGQLGVFLGLTFGRSSVAEKLMLRIRRDYP
jgi:hypothetical protein